MPILNIPHFQDECLPKSVFRPEKLWDNDSWPEGLNKGWDDLTPAEQEAVMVLGYNKLVGMGVMITLSI